jgi:hypothetical protein
MNAPECVEGATGCAQDRRFLKRTATASDRPNGAAMIKKITKQGYKRSALLENLLRVRGLSV